MLTRSRLAKLFQPAFVLMAMAVLLPAVLFALAAVHDYRVTLREAEARAERTVRILEEHALKIFETHRLIVEQIKDRLRSIDWSSEVDRADLQSMMVRLQRQVDQITTITVTDASGRMRASGRVYPADPTADFADRDWFQAFKSGNRHEAFVSRPFIGRQTGNRVFTFADERPRDRTGAFEGVISASVDPSYFEEFYRDVEPDFDHSVTLARDDGAVLAREPKTAATTLSPSPAVLLRMQNGGAGLYSGTSPLDGIERIYAYRKVGAYPVYVRFGVSRRAALTPWFDDLRSYGLVAAISSLALIAASALALRQTQREAVARRMWAATAAELRAEATERERVEEQLRQAQKMEVLGQLTGGIAHDFNNLLTVIIISLDALTRRVPKDDERAARLIGNAINGANRAAVLTHRLLAFSRRQPLEPKRLDANTLVAGMADLLRTTLGSRIEIDTVLAGDLSLIVADPNQLESAILNLAVNARDAMPDGGRLTIEVTGEHLDGDNAEGLDDVRAGSYVTVAVSDTGHGMAPDVAAKVFEPFFTTKPLGKGTGLGLSQVYGFAKQSGGHAAIDSAIDRGTTVKIYLPRCQGVREPAPPRAWSDIGLADLHEGGLDQGGARRPQSMT